MPHYSKSNIRYTIRDLDFKAMVTRLKGPFEYKAFLAILYCTGARPSEIAGDKARGLKGMTLGDIKFSEKEVTFYVPISKVRQHIYSVEKRQLTLEFDPDNIDFAINIIINFIVSMLKRQSKKGNEIDYETPLITFTRRTGYNIVNGASKILGVELCPYNFRHSRLTQLSEQGAGLETLMYSKAQKI